MATENDDDDDGNDSEDGGDSIGDGDNSVDDNNAGDDGNDGTPDPTTKAGPDDMGWSGGGSHPVKSSLSIPLVMCSSQSSIDQSNSID